MYFSFFKPQDWRKRSVVRGRGFIQRFPSILRIRWLSAAGLGVLVLGVVLMLVFCKCPHCGAHMRLRERKTGCCPECGKKLDD